MDPKAFLRQIPKGVELSPDEDFAVQKSIMQFVREHPIAEPAGEPSAMEQFWRMFTAPLRLVPVLAAVVLFFVFGAGFSLAAESALPGDFLYAIKVNVNEKAQASLIFSTDTRAHFEAARLVRRLEEATALAAADRLNKSLKPIVSQNINSQLALTQSAIAALSEKGDHAAALAMHTAIESNLVASAVILAAIVDEAGNTDDDAKDILKDISRAERAAINARAKEEAFTSSTSTSIRTAAERSVEQAMKQVQDVQAFIQLKKSAADPSIVIQAEARFDFAKRMLAAARSNLEAMMYEEAIQSTGEAQRAAMEAKAMLRISAKVRPYAK